MSYLLQLNDEAGRFEEVNNHVFEKRELIMFSDIDRPRYKSGFVHVCGNGRVNINLSNLNMTQITAIARYAGVETKYGERLGFIKECPEFLRVRPSRKGGKIRVMNTNNGELY